MLWPIYLRLARDICSSLFALFVSDEEKCFMMISTGGKNRQRSQQDFPQRSGRFIDGKIKLRKYHSEAFFELG
jgi:hypothetical protein